MNNLMKTLAAVSIFISVISNAAAFESQSAPTHAPNSIIQGVEKIQSGVKCDTTHIKKLSDCIVSSMLIDGIIKELSTPSYIKLMADNNINPRELLANLLDNNEIKKYQDVLSQGLQILATVGSIQELNGIPNSQQEKQYLKEINTQFPEHSEFVNYIGDKSKAAEAIGLSKSINEYNLSEMFARFMAPQVMKTLDSPNI